MDKSRIEGIVFQAMDRVNEVRLDDEALAKRLDTVLLGDGARLDSMGFINFIVALEEELAAELSINLNLSEQLNASTGNPPPTTAAEFVDFIFVAVQKQGTASDGR